MVAPSRVSHFLKKVTLLCMYFSNVNKPIQSPHPQPPPLSSSHTPGHYPPALITQWLDARQLGTAPVPQSLLKLFKLANPQSAYLPHPLVPVETIVKAFAHIPPHSLCLLTHPGGPHGKVYPLLLGTEKQVIFSMAIMSSPIGLAIHE